MRFLENLHTLTRKRPRVRLAVGFVGFVGLLGASACTTSSVAPEADARAGCKPGQHFSCGCPGSMGVEVCLDGGKLTPCICGIVELPESGSGDATGDGD